MEATPLKASIGALQFEVSPYSFFQVHKEQAEVLYGESAGIRAAYRKGNGD